RVVVVAVGSRLVRAGTIGADLRPVAEHSIGARGAVRFVVAVAPSRRDAAAHCAGVIGVAVERCARHALPERTAGLVAVTEVAVGTGRSRRAEIAGLGAARAPVGSLVALLTRVHDPVAAVLEGERVSEVRAQHTGDELPRIEPAVAEAELSVG